MIAEPNSCFSLLHSQERVERQLTETLQAVSGLKDYRNLLESLQQLDKEAQASCPELAAAVTDRAYEAESGGRVLIKHALDSINSLRDGGELYKLLGKAGEELANMQGTGLLNMLKGKGDEARQKYGEAAGDLFTEAVAAIEKLELNFAFKNGNILVERMSVNGHSDKVEIATARQPGQMGRISSDEFFGGLDGSVFVSPGQLFLPTDCHHRPKAVGGLESLPVDIYAGTVGGLATTKSLLYQHARRVSELGPRGLRGEDPVTAILIGIAVVGAALVIYGLATGDGFLVAFGAILIVGAALVAFGGYTLVLAIVA